MDFTRLIGGFLKLMGSTDGTLIGNAKNSLNVNLRDTDGSAAGTLANPLYVSGAVGPVTSGRVSVNEYNQALLVPVGATTTIVQFTVPDDLNYGLERVSVSGENIAQFTVLVNGSPIETQRTYFGGALNVEFNFISNSTIGYPLNEGDVVTVTVLQNRDTTANYESRIQLGKSS